MTASFGDLVPALVAARKLRGWTQSRLAAVLGMSLNAVASWERGIRVPARSNAQWWADALGVQLPDDTAGWFSKSTCRPVAVHGTRSGAQRHRNRDEPVCQPCLDADAAYQRAWRATRRA